MKSGWATFKSRGARVLGLSVGLTAAASLLAATVTVSAFDPRQGLSLDGTVSGGIGPTVDWANLFSASGQPAIQPNLTAASGLIASAFISDYATPDPSYFNDHFGAVRDGQSLSSWYCETEAQASDRPAPGKLLNAYAALIKMPAGTAAAGHLILYVGSERKSRNNAAEDQFFFPGFWLFRDPTVSCNTSTGTFSGQHSDGDLLVLADYRNKSGFGAEVYRWSSATGGLVKVGAGPLCSSTAANVCGIGNSTPLAPASIPWAPGSSTGLAPTTFVEAGIDLTSLFGPNLPCYSRFQAETRGSDDLSGALEDYAGSSFNTCAAAALATSSGQKAPIGSSATDAAQLIGASADAGGTVTYSLFATPDCSGTPVFSSTESVTSGAVPRSAPATLTNLGRYQWLASYSGDSRNWQAAARCGDEPIQVVPASPAITTGPDPISGLQGTAIRDTARVQNGYAATGTVSFFLYGPGDTTCANDLVKNDARFKHVPLRWGSAASPAYPASLPGEYHWLAVYSGDALNYAASDRCGNPAESAVIAAAAPQAGSSSPPGIGAVSASVSSIGLPSTGALGAARTTIKQVLPKSPVDSTRTIATVVLVVLGSLVLAVEQRSRTRLRSLRQMSWKFW